MELKEINLSTYEIIILYSLGISLGTAVLISSAYIYLAVNIIQLIIAVCILCYLDFKDID